MTDVQARTWFAARARSSLICCAALSSTALSWATLLYATWFWRKNTRNKNYCKSFSSDCWSFTDSLSWKQRRIKRIRSMHDRITEWLLIFCFTFTFNLHMQNDSSMTVRPRKYAFPISNEKSCTQDGIVPNFPPDTHNWKKYKIFIFPTGLEVVHLEDMFWV